MDKSIWDALKAHTAAYNEGFKTSDMSPYKAAAYELRKAVKVAKRRHRNKVKGQLCDWDARAFAGGRTFSSLALRLPTLARVWWLVPGSTAERTAPSRSRRQPAQMAIPGAC